MPNPQSAGTPVPTAQDYREAAYRAGQSALSNLAHGQLETAGLREEDARLLTSAAGLQEELDNRDHAWLSPPQFWELKDARAQVATLQEENNDAIRKILELEHMVADDDALLAQIVTLQADADQKQRDIDELIAEWSETQEQWRAQVATLQEARALTDQWLTITRRKFADVERQLTEAQRELEDVRLADHNATMKWIALERHREIMWRERAEAAERQITDGRASPRLAPEGRDTEGTGE